MEIQGQTRQHSRLINLLGMKQIYTDENKMDCDTAGYEQKWYDEISNDLKNMLIKCQHSNTMPSSTHSWFAPDYLFCTNNSTSSVSRITFNIAVTVEMRMLCISVEGNSHFHHESIFGMCFLCDGVETSQAWTAQLMSFCSCVWQAQTAHQSTKKYEFDDYIFAFTTEMNGKIT